MDIFASAYLFSLALLVIFIASNGIRAFINWQTPGGRTLGMLMFSMAIWAGFYLLEVAHPDLSVKILARKLLFLGMVLSAPYWLGYSLRYTGVSTWWSRSGRSFLLAVPGGIAFLLGWTNEFHHWIWKSLSLPETSPAPLVVEYNTGFWITLALNYFLVAAGMLVHIVAYIKNGKTFRIKTGVVLIGIAISAVANLFSLFYEHDLLFDLTPLSFAFSATLIAFGFFRFGTTSLFPLAATLVVENLRDAIIVVNDQNEITNVNQAAADLLNLKTIGQNLSVFSILPSPERIREIWDTPDVSIKLEIKKGETSYWYDVRVASLAKLGETPIGRMVVFYEITKEQYLLRAETRRSQQLTLLEETGRRIADSFDENEILLRTVDAITQQFRYPETAISVLTSDNMLKIAVISGTEDFGYRPGYQQKLGTGIIGYTASQQKTYVSGNVSKDEHYFSTSTRSGSAICTPIFKQGKLYGVLYVESFELNAFDELDVITLETLASQVSESLQRAVLYAQTQETLRTLTTLQNISKLVAGSLDLETISQTVVQSLQKAFGYTYVSIYLLQDEYLQLHAQVGYPNGAIIQKIHVSQGVSGRTVRTRSVQFIEDITKENLFLKTDPHIISEICIPLLKEDLVLGTLNVESSQRGQLTHTDVELLTTIAGPIAIAIDNARLHAELKRMATTDAVTGLSNRHVFEQALHAEVERAERSDTSLSLIIFDIDFFKQYNDQNGHPAGDARLKAVADIIKQNLRKYDTAARYGGDEFAIILSDCTQEHAVAFAERLRQGTRVGAPEAREEDNSIPGHTLSMGIATFPQDATLPYDLLIAADNAAMRSKQQGRNRIRLANDHEST